MHPAGIYHGTPDTAVTSTAKTGTPQLVITFNLTHVADGPSWVELPTGQTADVYLFLSDAAWPFTEEKLKALGFNGDFADPKFSDQVYAEGVDLECRHESYQGKVRAKFEMMGGNKPEPAAADVMRQLNARWKAKTAPAPRPAPGTRPAPPPKAAETPVGAGTDVTA